MSKHLSILLVEDDARDAALIKHELRQGGYDSECKRVQHFAEFVSALGQCSPDLILCDNGLPGLDGETVLVLAQQRCPGVPFVFLTATVTDKLRQSGATACVQKDRLASDLMPVIQSALGNRGAAGHRKFMSSDTKHDSHRQTSNGDTEPQLASIKAELAGILKVHGEATISLSVLKQAWARKEGRLLFFAKPRLEALAEELDCDYVLDSSGNTTTFVRRKTEHRKGDQSG